MFPDQFHFSIGGFGGRATKWNGAGLNSGAATRKAPICGRRWRNWGPTRGLRPASGGIWRPPASDSGCTTTTIPTSLRQPMVA